MKELYIAPELEILCFAPVENLASTWDGDITLQSASGSDMSNAESRPGDYGDTVPTESMDPLN